MIHGNLFWVFLAGENTVQPLFSNTLSVKGQKKVQIRLKPRERVCTHTQPKDHPCDTP